MSPFIGESDNNGGASPSFLVEWAADGNLVGPMVESVMVTPAGSQEIVLTGVGRIIADRHH